MVGYGVAWWVGAPVQEYANPNDGVTCTELYCIHNSPARNALREYSKDKFAGSGRCPSNANEQHCACTHSCRNKHTVVCLLLRQIDLYLYGVYWHVPCAVDAVSPACMQFVLRKFCPVGCWCWRFVRASLRCLASSDGLQRDSLQRQLHLHRSAWFVWENCFIWNKCTSV